MRVADLITLLSRWNPERSVFVKTGETDGKIDAVVVGSVELIGDETTGQALILLPQQPPPQPEQPKKKKKPQESQ